MDATIQSLETRVQRLEEQLVQCHDERMMFMRAYKLLWDSLPSAQPVAPVLNEYESSVSIGFTIGGDGAVTMGETTQGPTIIRSGADHASATTE